MGSDRKAELTEVIIRQDNNPAVLPEEFWFAHTMPFARSSRSRRQTLGPARAPLSTQETGPKVQPTGDATMGDESRISTPGTADVPTQGQQQQAPQVQFQVDTSGMASAYTNWYRVTGTPEELILDFGLNPQMGQMPT